MQTIKTAGKTAKEKKWKKKKQVTITLTEKEFEEFTEVTKANNRTVEEGLKDFVKEVVGTYRFIKILKNIKEN